MKIDKLPDFKDLKEKYEFLNQMRVIATHDGPHHCDEVGFAHLFTYLNEDVKILRSRDPQVLKKADLCFDIGGGFYDHHQILPPKVSDRAPYASVGLFWRDFGDLYLSELSGYKKSETLIKKAHKIIDLIIIEKIDALDNGIDVCDFKDCLNLTKEVDLFNPLWNEDVSSNEGFFQAVDHFASIFKKACKIILSAVDTLSMDSFSLEMYKKMLSSLNDSKEILIRKQKVKQSKSEAKKQIQKLLVNRAHKNILVLDQYYPWKKHLLDLDSKKEILFVIFPTQTGEFIVHTCPNSKKDNDFRARKDLPTQWAGLKDIELSKLTKIQNCTFCHKSLFIAGNKTFDGAMKMAKKAISC